MNRRTFLAVLGALVALPKVLFGREAAAPPESFGRWAANGWTNAPLTTHPVAQMTPARNLMFGGSPVPEWVFGRADRRIEAHSLVVWDFVDARGVPRIRAAKSRDDIERHAALGRAGFTTCAVDQHNYTVINTRSGMVRVEGSVLR
jgi:hypothetical protein